MKEILRLDARLLEAGLVMSRQRGQDHIKNGQVRVDGITILKPGHRVTRLQTLEVDNADFLVSRSAHKLGEALIACKVSLAGKVCLDIGASTGGFTQVCLLGGAKKVYANDVGDQQLHPSLRNNPRVICLENTHIKDLKLPEKVDFSCIDVSFISATKILHGLKEHLKAEANVMLLVKPQFEVGREKLPSDGIVKNIYDQIQATKKVLNYALKENYEFVSQMKACITGKNGNQEYFLHLRTP